MDRPPGRRLSSRGTESRPTDLGVRVRRLMAGFWQEARIGHGPSHHFDTLLRNGAGGEFSVVGTTSSASRSPRA
ncbi:MAG TPA: hypothetical protein VJ885_04075 [Thermoanaerobaculia bacterium]|nr:hypothetical protein [Thermoanaerobaculia bacterium]